MLLPHAPIPGQFLRRPARVPAGDPSALDGRRGGIVPCGEWAAGAAAVPEGPKRISAPGGRWHRDPSSPQGAVETFPFVLWDPKKDASDTIVPVFSRRLLMRPHPTARCETPYVVFGISKMNRQSSRKNRTAIIPLRFNSHLFLLRIVTADRFDGGIATTEFAVSN